MPSQSLFFGILSIVCIIVQRSSAETSTNCPNIATRLSWGGQQAKKGVSHLVVPLSYVTIHHTVTLPCSSEESCSSNVRNIQTYHMNNFGWNDIGYSFLIGGDGNIYEGVGWTREGAHTYGWNKKSVGIAFIGNYQDSKASEKMMNAARKLIDCGKAEGYLRNDVKVLGARQVISTLSPGQKLFEQIKKWDDWSFVL